MSDTEESVESVPAGSRPAPSLEAPGAPAAPQPEKLYCPQCGAAMGVDQRYCTECGWDAEEPDRTPPGAEPYPGPLFPPRELGPPSQRNRLTALLLCILIGFLGAHRFYIGRPLSGLLWLATLGLLGVGVIYDAVMIATGEMRDDQGKRLLHWQ